MEFFWTRSEVVLLLLVFFKADRFTVAYNKEKQNLENFYFHVLEIFRKK